MITNPRRLVLTIVGSLALVAVGALGLRALADPGDPIHSPAPTASQPEKGASTLTAQELVIVRTVAEQSAAGTDGVHVVAAKATLEDYFATFAPDVEGTARQNAPTTDVLIVALDGAAPNVTRRGPVGAPEPDVIGQIIVTDLQGQALGRTLVERSGETSAARGSQIVDVDLSLSAFNPIEIKLG